MLQSVLACLVLACGTALAEHGDPCLAPICVVGEPCNYLLPYCARRVKGIDQWAWVHAENDRVRGTPGQKGVFYLGSVLTHWSCHVTIFVEDKAAAEASDYCDYKASNASLKLFEEHITNMTKVLTFKRVPIPESEHSCCWLGSVIKPFVMLFMMFLFGGCIQLYLTRYPKKLRRQETIAI